MMQQGSPCARVAGDRGTQGRASSDHLHAVRASPLSGRCQGPSGNARLHAHRQIARDWLSLPPELEFARQIQISAVYEALVRSQRRNDLIFNDVLRSLQNGRRPVVLTERRDHLDTLRSRFDKFTRHLVVLYGGMSASERRESEAALKRSEADERLVLATGRYLGEGFDDASLDTLFLKMPISWKAALAQYVGRLHREHYAKREVIVYDYVDSGVPILMRTASKR